MRILIFWCLVFLLILTTGCAGLYSQQDFGPNSISGSTLEEVIQQNSPPDEYASVGDRNLLIWRGGQDSYSVWDKILTGIPLFGIAHKEAVGVVVSKEGEVLTIGKSKGPNNVNSILSVYSHPVFIVE